MPRKIEMMVYEKFTNRGVSQKVDVATEEELLEFANKVRDAGGANILEALLPSTPGNSSQCLIANALNFSCEVTTIGTMEDAPFESKWGMYLPHNMDHATAKKIAAAVDCKLNDDDGHCYIVELPRHIGNAANAFDHRLAFNDFAVDEYGNLLNPLIEDN